ncbi:hypothetical protein HQ560_02075, partial [bacterium]|nr:hypothetical protein [bacterium]
MSNFTKLALLAMLTVVCAHVATSAEPLHHWPFDGALPEGTMAHGAARFVSETDAPGAVGKALALGVQTGDASHLTLPAPPLGPTYTIEAWILPTQLGQWNRLVLRWGGAGKYAYHLALHNGQASLCHGQSDGKYLFAEGGRVKVGQWHHLVGVADAGAKKIRITLDGRRVGETVFDGTMQPATGEGLGIGDSVSIASAGSRFHGYLDGITIWDRALTEAEISTHYAERAPVLAKLAAVGRKAELAKRGSVIKKLLDLGVEEIVFAERNPGRDPSGHYYANFGYSCIDPNYWIHGSDGGRLSVLNIRTGELRALVDDARGAVRDPQVHYDGKGVLFAYRRGGTHHYNLYEARDGKLRQITDGPWDDVEPTYLPSGGIIFCSTRCKRYIGCWLAQSATLHRCDGDGGNIRMLSSGAFTENTPSVLHDGRILYTRWEYVNRDPVSFHHLWAMNPDGSGATAWFGNMYPGGVFIDAKPIPGTQDVALIHSPGHGRNEHAGRVAIVSSKLGPDNRTAMRNISRQADCRDPYPLSADAFLVARGNQILLMDASGAMELVHVAAQMVHEPCPLVPRPREPEPASRMDPALATGTLVLADVYHGRNMAGVKRGAIT